MTQTFTFNSNNTFTVEVLQPGWDFTREGTYSISRSNLSLIYSDDPDPVIWTFSISGNTLTLTRPGVAPRTYTKV